MSEESLHHDLLAVPGVAAAVVSGDAPAPKIAVTLAAGADATLVGEGIRRVLAAHGIASRLGNGSGPMPASPLPDATGSEAEPEPAAAALPVSEDRTLGALASLGVTESPDEVVVVATADDGRRFSRVSRPDPEAVAAAVVAVVGALFTGRPPRLLAVTHDIVSGTEVVTVVLERVDGVRAAGAAVVASGRPYAVARATWAALRP